MQPRIACANKAAQGAAVPLGKTGHVCTSNNIPAGVERGTRREGRRR
jgi:hypothetical protein